MSDEHKAKMRAGRERAAAERKAKAIIGISKHPELLNMPKKLKAVPEFLGITKTDCPVGCTFEHCIITGGPYCGHPCKGGIQPAQMQNRETVERYNRARKHLAHVELDKRP